MNLKKKWQHFWTLNRHHAEGFTLVELIVVIAILAILGGVAVPAYSGYVERANKQADISLASEVAHALELAYYNQKLPNGGAVVLTKDGVDQANMSDDVKAALEAVFGSIESIEGLKYSDWKGVSSGDSYASSNYYENEGTVLREVNKLTDVLAESLKNITFEGGRYEAFLKQYNIGKSDYTAASNAMVLYVAQEVSNPQYQTTIENAMSTIGTAGVDGAYNTMTGAGVSQPVALAVIYSYAEGLALYADKNNGNNTVSSSFHNNTSPEKFAGITDATGALNVINTAFNTLATDTGFNADGNSSLANTYLDSTATDGGMNDLKGFMDIMGTVWDSKEIVDGNLATDDCFTDGTVENLLVGYSGMASMGVATQDGQMAIGLTPQNGNPVVSIFPLNYNK